MISPVCFELGPISVRWYGVLTALGALACFSLMIWRSKKYSVKKDHIGDVMLITMVAAVIGARLFYVVRFWNDNFAHRPFSAVFKVWEGGLVFQGGFIFAALAIIAYTFFKKIPLGQLGDLFAPALPLGHAIGRIGCLINGCCYGFLPYDGPCAVYYDFSRANHFPAQAVEALGNVIVCVALLALEKFKIAKDKLFLVYLMAYTVLRFAVEPLRGDYPIDQEWNGLTPGQYHGLWQLPLLLVIYVALTFYAKRKNKA